MQKIIETLEGYAPISQEAYQAILEVAICKQYKKGDSILTEGSVCQQVGFVEKGLTRGFYYEGGKDVTTYFASEEEPCLSVYSFISQQPSLESIEVLEDSTIWSVAHDALQNLYKEFPELNLIGRLLIENYYMLLEEHLRSLKHKSSKDRYLQFIEKEPDLVQRVSLTHIASFLGMTKENLSRVRRI
jgi:CRP-like cAMP-binding protein